MAVAVEHHDVVGVVREHPSHVAAVHSLGPTVDQIPDLSFVLGHHLLHPIDGTGSVASMMWTSRSGETHRGTNTPEPYVSGVREHSRIVSGDHRRMSEAEV